MPLAAGTRLGPYEILSPIGKGGMGEVYRARDTRLGRDVAVKVSAEKFSDRFEREARSIAALNHPNICQLYDVGPNYLVMECIEGQPLSHVTRSGGMRPESVARYAVQIADALVHAHDRGVIHRDLKTANMILTNGDQIKVLDFGLAKRIVASAPHDATQTLDSVTEPGIVTGTPAYLAPEVLRGQPSDERSDLWAFGVALYEMVCGQAPFRGATQAELFSAILTAPLVAVPSSVPSGFRAIIERCLAKDPALRYQRAVEIRNDLASLARGRARRPAARASSRIRSIAVLPLANLSRDEEQTYFADGMTEALITDLAKIGVLKVISRTTAMRYRGTDKPLPEIARELGVDGILEGSVMRDGAKVRITAQLIHAASDTHLWAENYDRDFQDILSLQSDVAQAIARAIHATLTPEEKRRLSARPTVNPKAHELYLKGRYFWSQRGSGLKKSIEFFERALAEEPNYAPAYAGLADSYALLGFYGYAKPADVMPQAKDAARKALALDADLTEAHAALGYVHMMFDWDWEQATKEFQRAIKLNQGYSPARYWHSILLFTLGQHEECIAEAKRSLECDPLSVYGQTHVGIMLLFARRIVEAREQLVRAAELDPQFMLARVSLAACDHLLSRSADAIRELESTVEATGRDPWPLAYLGAVCAAVGQRDRAVKILEELEARRSVQHISSVNIAAIYANLGDLDKAFESFSRAHQERDALYSMLYHPLIVTTQMRNDPRYTDLLRRVGLKHE